MDEIFSTLAAKNAKYPRHPKKEKASVSSIIFGRIISPRFINPNVDKNVDNDQADKNVDTVFKAIYLGEEAPEYSIPFII